MGSEYYIPAGGIIVLIIGSLFAVKDSISNLKTDIGKRPTFEEAEKKFKEIKVCDEIHKATEEKLKCIPDIKDTVTVIETKMDMLLIKNGIEYVQKR